MKNPIDRLTRRWKRKQEKEQIRHTLPNPSFSDATRFEIESKRRGASPGRVKLFREHGLSPEFSKARRERNKQRRLARTSRGHRLPHGRQTRPKVKQHG